MPDRWVNPRGWGRPPADSGSPGQGPATPPQRPTWRAAAEPPEGWEPPRWQGPPAWGPPPPRPPASGGRWWRRWYVVLAAALVVLGMVALGDEDDPSTTTSGAPMPSTYYSLPTVGATSTTALAPATTVARVRVPKLVGMKLASARTALADRGLRATITYRVTSRYRAGTVISQSRQTGDGVLPDTRISLVVAKAPPPPPTTKPPPPPPPPTAPSQDCDPSYPDVCLDPNAEDYDCAGGSGNGPRYVEGPLRVRPPDQFDLDRDGDGIGCED